MSRPSVKQEHLNEVVEDALELACDTEEVLTRFRAVCDELLLSARERKHRISVRGHLAGFPHARREVLERAG